MNEKERELKIKKDKKQGFIQKRKYGSGSSTSGGFSNQIVNNMLLKGNFQTKIINYGQ